MMLGPSAPRPAPPPNPFQTPVISGLPSERRGSGPAGPFLAPRPGPRPLVCGGGVPLSWATARVRLARVAAAMTNIASFFRTWSLPWRRSLLIGRRVPAGRSCKHAASVGQHYAAGIGGFRTVLGERSFDRDLITLLQRIFAPALFQQHGNRAQLEVPIGNLAVGVLHVDVESRVRIHPLHLGDNSRDGDRLFGVILGGE